MKSLRLVFALATLAAASACSSDSLGPTSPSYDTVMGSPGRCNDPTVCP